MPTTTRNGIAAGDRVILYTDSYRGPGGGLRRANLRYAEVERVTATQIVVENIRYKADKGVPVSIEEQYQDPEGDNPGGSRRFAHPNKSVGVTWEMLLAEIEHPEGLARARALFRRTYEMLGYPFSMTRESVPSLAADEETLTRLEAVLDETERIRQQALDAAREAFRPYARDFHA